MSSQILQALWDVHAFKSKPPEHELARAHVAVADVGIPRAIDERVITAMAGPADGLTLVVGPPGSGKSSLFAAAIATVVSDLERRPLVMPLKVPVAHYRELVNAELLVKGITQSLAYAIGPELSDNERCQLEQSLATTIASAHSTPSVTVGVSGGPAFLRGNVGAEFGRDLVTVTARPEWQAAGPVPALGELQRLAGAHGLDVVVIFDDTDIWSAGDAEMAHRARSFFSALRVLQDCPDVSILVAVQSHWTLSSDSVASATAHARREYQELAERVDSTLTVPRPQTKNQAEALMVAIIDRRVELALPAEPKIPDAGWARTLFTPDALDLLANRCMNTSIRRAIGDIRDALDHVEEMPDRVTADLLLTVIDE